MLYTYVKILILCPKVSLTDRNVLRQKIIPNKLSFQTQRSYKLRFDIKESYHKSEEILDRGNDPTLSVDGSCIRGVHVPDFHSPHGDMGSVGQGGPRHFVRKLCIATLFTFLIVTPSGSQGSLYTRGR